MARRLPALIVTALLAGAGCKQSAPTCEAAVEHLSVLAKEKGAEIPAASSEQLVQVCKDQKWSAEMRRCVNGADSPEAAQACLGGSN